jgi:hypothetical protein
LERLRRSDNEYTGDIVNDVTNNSVKMKLELGRLVITRRGIVNVIVLLSLAAVSSCLFRFRTSNMMWEVWWRHRNRAGVTFGAVKKINDCNFEM